MYEQLLFRGCFKTSAIELKDLQECGATSESDKNRWEPVFCCRNGPSALLTPEVCFISRLLLSTSCVVFYPSRGAGIRNMLRLSC